MKRLFVEKCVASVLAWSGVANACEWDCTEATNREVHDAVLAAGFGSLGGLSALFVEGLCPVEEESKPVPRRPPPPAFTHVAPDDVRLFFVTDLHTIPEETEPLSVGAEVVSF